jgi:hypothetical protein
MGNFGNTLQNIFMHQRLTTSAKLQDTSNDMSDEALLGRYHSAETKELLSTVILNSFMYFFTRLTLTSSYHSLIKKKSGNS